MQRIAKSVALQETDRVPFVYATRFWAARAFGITYQKQMYYADKAIEVNKAAILMLQPDAFVPSLNAFGATLDALQYRPMKWPGQGAEPDHLRFRNLCHYANRLTELNPAFN